MFKKRSVNKAKKQQLRKRQRTDDEDDANGEGDASVLAAIAKTQQKHKILSSLPMTSGGIGKSTTVVNSNTDEQQQDDQDQPLSLLAQKHQQAMEEYINTNIDSSGSQRAPGADEQKQQEPSVTDEAALYQELARQAAGQSSGNSNVTNPSKTSVALDDDAGGSGGAVLVGGTGITEVTLPIQMRLDSASGRSSNATKLGSIQATSAISSAAPPQAFRGSSSTSNKSSIKLLPSKMAATTRNTNYTTASTSSQGAGASSSLSPQRQSEDNSDSKESTSRMGFQMARGIVSSSTSQTNDGKKDNSYNQNRGSGGAYRQQHGSTDDRVFKQFITRHRDQNFK